MKLVFVIYRMYRCYLLCIFKMDSASLLKLILYGSQNMKSQVLSSPAALAASTEFNPPKVSISNRTTYTLAWNLILTEQEVTTGFIIPNKKMKFTIEGEQ